MSEKYFVGNDITSFSDNGKYKPISRVTLLVDDENSLTAGDDTGMEIVASCPHATQSMVNSLLQTVKGYQYQAYEAGAANIDPAAELGDGVTVGGVYSPLSKIIDNGRGYADISSPGEMEMEDEYPSEGYIAQEFNRKIAETRSAITKTSEEINLEIQGVDGRVSTLQLTLDGVTVTGSDGVTRIKGGMIEANSVTATQIDATNLKVKAANITGSLTIGQLPDSVAETSDIPSYTSELINDSGYQNATGVTTIIDGRVTTDYVNALGITAWYLQGNIVTVKGLNGTTYGQMYAGTNTEGSTAFELYGQYGLRLTAGGNVYISSSYNTRLVLQSDGAYIGPTVYQTNGTLIASDRELKHDIEYDLEDYDVIFDNLKPSRFKYNDGTSDRYHTALIAQDVKEAVLAAGLTTQDFAGYCEVPVYEKDDDGNPTGNITGYTCALRYDEFMALAIRQIQMLKARVAELERRLAQ